MYEDMWKKDHSKERLHDAALFIKEAFSSPLTKTASASSIRNKIIGGAAALGALGLGSHEYMKGKTLPSGVTQRQAESIARQAQDAKYEELTGKRRAKLVRFLDDKNEQLGKKMDENRKIAIPAKAVLGGTVAGYSAKKALDFVKNNARLL